MRRRRPSASTQPRAAWRSINRDVLLSSAPLSTNEKRVGMLERGGPLELSSSRQMALCGLLGTLSIGKRRYLEVDAQDHRICAGAARSVRS
jgi:hypothetical protein